MPTHNTSIQTHDTPSAGLRTFEVDMRPNMGRVAVKISKLFIKKKRKKEKKIYKLYLESKI
jgi:hypothetical protein